MPATTQTAISVIGIDIGKNSFHIVGLDDRGTLRATSGREQSQQTNSFAVGTRVTSRPPHRSVQAAFPHTAPTSGVDGVRCRMRANALCHAYPALSPARA
jgi:hypothetical protein